MPGGFQSLPLSPEPDYPRLLPPPPPRAARAARLRAWAAWTCFLSAAVLAADGLILEPNWIEVRRAVDLLPGLRPIGSDLTVVHLSDLHIDRIGYREREAIRIVNEARPDLIVITGDLVGGGGRPKELSAFLGALQARYGKFLVWGNHDYWDRITRTWGPEAVRAGGFTLLRNDNRRVETPAGILRIAGVDDPVTGRDDVRAAMAGALPGEIGILLAHSPEIVREMPPLPVQRIFAGHTHGGQVCLPWIGALIIPFGTRDYVDGWYDVAGGARMHVSRGLGMSWLPVRFLCRPCIDVIDLRPAAEGSAPSAAGGARAIADRKFPASDRAKS